MQNARLSLESGDPQAALSDIEHAIRLAPDHADTQFLYGQVLMKLGRYDEAKRALISARDNDICPLRATSTILRTLRQVCKSENAPLIDFEATVESLSPHRIPGASLFLDHVHPTIRGHRRLALDIFDWMVHQGITTKPAEWSQIVETVTQRVEGQIDQTAHGAALRNLAKVLTWAGKKEEANRLAIQAAELTENDAETVYLAGNALLKQGELDKAILKFQRAIEQDPNHVLALNSLGTALMQKRDFEGAQRSFQRALQLKPDFAPVHSNLGSLYQRTGNIDQALSHYRSAIRVNSRYSKGYNNIGALLRQQEKYDEAIEYLRKAIAINPNFAEAHYNLAASLERLNRLAEAESEYRRAIQINRGFRPAIVGLGTVLERQKRWSEAARVYREASRPPNPSLEASYRLAWLMATCPDPKLRNGRLALQIATQCAKATNYRHPEVLSTLAAANAELGDFAEAIKWQSQALSLANSGDREKHQTRLNVLRQSRPLRSS